MIDALRSGVRTSEFWVTVSSMAAAVILIGVGLWRADETLVGMGMVMLGLPPAAYSVGRSIVKAKWPKAALPETLDPKTWNPPPELPPDARPTPPGRPPSTTIRTVEQASAELRKKL